MKYKKILPIMTSMLLALPLAAQTYGTDNPRQDRQQQWGQQEKQDRQQQFGQQDRQQQHQQRQQFGQQDREQRFGQQDQQRAYGQQQQYRQQQQRQFGQQQQRGQNPVRSSDIIGAKVIGINGENIGQVEELYVDLDSGEVLGAVISSGGIMGLGGNDYRVPLHELNFDAQEKEVQLNWTQARLRNAPPYHGDTGMLGDSQQAWSDPEQGQQGQQQDQERFGQRGQQDQNQQRFGQQGQQRTQTQQRGW